MLEDDCFYEDDSILWTLGIFLIFCIGLLFIGVIFDGDEKDNIRLDIEYELVSVEADSGKNELDVYHYRYKREDGGTISDIIDLNHHPNVKVIVYEVDNNSSPKVEIWRDWLSKRYGEDCENSCTEFRFYVPTETYAKLTNFHGTE